MTRDDEDFLPSSASAEYWQSADHGRRDALRKAVERKTGISISQGDMDSKTALDLLKLQAMLTGDAALVSASDASAESASSQTKEGEEGVGASTIDDDRKRIDQEHEAKRVAQESAQEHQSDAG